ncbi:endonuclease domain-containing protein [Thermoleptolyngbya sp. PKUAC-SCTB121]|uniref:endonuclease domain-containing protein n=1 Tax=Thermoleptolyngbya sp. PKUAC-SCTB121 TaxID=2811482 RepID=UPI001964EDAC|nr:endonuclease domain-containing protein [Thermoleptolyngbya sp. PKUAC-SCTB121]
MVKKTFNRIRGTTPNIEQATKHLRKHQTPAESRLWEVLRNKKLHGLRFRRQHPVGNFIADFYCPACKLVIELDGGIHTHRADYDAARTQEMAAYGYRVIRFENQQVLDDLNSVLDVIYQEALSRSPPK